MRRLRGGNIIGRLCQQSILVVCLLGFLSSARADSLLRFLSPQERKKLDALVHILLSDPQFSQDHLLLGLTQRGERVLNPLLVKANADIREMVQDLGGFVGSRHGSIYTVYIPPEMIVTLVGQKQVEYIEGAKRLGSELDTSLPDNGTTFVHHIPPQGLRGNGVIVGITDSGLDLTHPDFTDSLGKTRVLYLWDQYSSGGPRPLGFSYGSEYTKEQIDLGLSAQKDNSGHGTRVAGIAAGNGKAAGYVGMAPDADLIIVKALGGMLDNILEDELDTAGLLDAYAYIRMRAQSLGRPFVINTSRGTTIGPHDGTTLLSQAVNAEVAAGATIVVSAGNYSNDGWHAEAVAEPGEPVTFDVDVGAGQELIYLDFWYETDDLFQLEIAAPSVDFLSFVLGDTTVSLYEDYARILTVSKTCSPLNLDNEFFVRLAGPLSGGEIPQGIWRFRFTSLPDNELPDGGEVDGWIVRDVDAEFVNFVDPSETIGELATSDSVISVAAYNNKSTPRGVISSFSSIGPRRDGVLKPDLAAAGGGVVAPRSQSSDDDLYRNNPYYTYGSGTSFSAPHVAGAAALLLEQNCNLTAGQIKKELMRSGREDESTGPIPNPTWGHGKLDVVELLAPYLHSVSVSGDVRYQGTPVPATLLIHPFGVEYATLGRTITLAPDSLSFSTNLLPGTYTVTTTPQFPLAVRTEELSISIDLTEFLWPTQVDMADVLFVDDEPLDYETYVLASLDSLPLAYSVWPDSSESIPPLTYAAGQMDKPLTIWITGDERDSVLTKQEQDTLVAFLEKGGGLLLSGQNIIESVDSSTFALDYLRTNFVENTRIVLLHGEVGDPIVGEFPYLLIGSTGGASNQTSCDVLSPVDSPTPLFYYDAARTKTAGVRVEGKTAHWRLVFLGFGIEAVATLPSRLDFLSREQLLANVLYWLSGASPTVVPQGQSRPVLPQSPDLVQVHPNPVADRQSAISIVLNLSDVKQQGDAHVRIVNLLGQVVKRFDLLGGIHPRTIQWDGKDESGCAVAAGLYLICFDGWDFSAREKIVLLE